MANSFLVLFEDERAADFEPLALTRSVASLRLGAWTHRERWARLLPDRAPCLLVRDYLADAEAAGGWHAVNRVPDGDVLFVAAALGLATPPLARRVQALVAGEALVADGRLVAARTGADGAARLAAALRERVGADPFPPPADPIGTARLEEIGLAPSEVEVELPAGLVDLMGANAAAIAADFVDSAATLPAPAPADFPGVHLVAPQRIRLAAGAKLGPGVVLDAREGPVVIGARTQVGANSVVTGPVSLGRDGIVRPLSRVSHGVSLGPVCRIGGEVDSSIFQGWSNKQHDGFLGHSVLGAWVNLGAATDTSDLKNDYGTVRIVVGGREVDTGSAHVGSLVGDHSKTGIHTQLNTGTVIGVSVNVFGPGMPPREIPSFSWGGGSEWQEYRLEKAIRVARTVTARRDVEFAAAEEAVFGVLHRVEASRRRRLVGGSS